MGQGGAGRAKGDCRVALCDCSGPHAPDCQVPPSLQRAHAAAAPAERVVYREDDVVVFDKESKSRDGSAASETLPPLPPPAVRPSFSSQV